MGILNLSLCSASMVGMVRRLLLFALGFFVISSVSAENLQVKPAKGDGIHTLLKRYNLHKHACDRDSFLHLNELNERDYLVLHKTYILPLKIYQFDGTSIRSSMGMTDYDKALRIQNYNDSLWKIGVKAENFRTDKILWVPYRELYCKQNESAEGSESVFKPYTMQVPIMGPEYSDVEVTDQKLAGCVYYLVSGHGGPDPGAMTYKGEHALCEDEYAYDVTLRVARNLLSHGAKVYMIIRDQNDGIRDEKYLGYDKDETCWKDQPIPAGQVARLKQRTDAINTLYDQHAESAKLQRAVAIHVDSRTQGKKIDIFFYHFPGSTGGKTLADTVLNTFRMKYKQHQQNREYSGVVKSRDLWMLRESKPTTIYLELGNITNTYDQRRLLIVNNRQAIANWLTEGLLKEVD